MSTRKPVHRTLRRFAFARALGAFASSAALVATLMPSVEAEAAPKSAACRVASVQATPEGDGSIPAELDWIKSELSGPQFSAFKNFKLLETKQVTLNFEELVEQRIKPAHSFKLKLLSADDKGLKIHASLMKKKTIVDADYKIRHDGVILIPVVKGDSAVIFAIQCHGRS